MRKPVPQLVAGALLGLSLGARAEKITEFPIPTVGGSPHTITWGPDGRLWFTEYYPGQLGAITTSGVIQEYPLDPNSRPLGIANVGKGRTLAYTLEAGGKIGFLSLDGPDTEVPGFSLPTQITAGPEGRVWFTQAATDAPLYAEHWLDNSPASAPFPNPGVSFNGVLEGIALGPDGRIWYTDRGTNRIGACPPEGGSCVTFPIPTPASRPTRIAAGKDGNLWFTERDANKIGRITTTGVITEFPVPTPASHPFGIVGGNDGNIWFTEFEGSKIGRITPAGVITEYPTPTAGSGPTSITNGPDGNMWFTEFYVHKIGVLRVHISGDVDTSGLLTPSDILYLINFLFAGGPPPKS